MQPHVNEPTPSSMACQCVGARLTSLSSPSQQNDTPTSIPTRSIQNVLQEDQHMSTDEAGEPSINEDDDLLLVQCLKLLNLVMMGNNQH